MCDKCNCCRKTRYWNKSVQVYTEGKRITVEKNAFAFTFTNVGNDIAHIDDMVFFPSPTPATDAGDFRSLTGHYMDLYNGRFNLSFAGVGNAPAMEVVQLYYMDEKTEG
jgi:hypothetical protein